MFLQAALADALGPQWKVGEIIGRGGFGEVYAARDLRMQRDLAVKVLHPWSGNSSASERFRREATLLAQLRHPHIVPVYDIGDKDGMMYLIMPLLRGACLADLVQNGNQLSIAESQRITAEVADALSAVHGLAVVHRDVKPDNILLAHPRDEAILLDFGIAKHEGVSGDSLTTSGMIVGSPLYMSPEQIGGGAVTRLSDQYSLALVMYRMLSGRLPFEGGSPEVAALRRLVEQPPRITQWRADVPPRVVSALARALSLEPDQRFADVAEFGRAVALGTASPTMTSDVRWFVTLEQAAGEIEPCAVEVHRMVIVGRDASADIRLPEDDPRASRHHCRIERDRDHLIAVDLDSKNGMYVNGVRVKRALLRSGDGIRCGRAIVRIRTNGALRAEDERPARENTDGDHRG